MIIYVKAIIPIIIQYILASSLFSIPHFVVIYAAKFLTLK